MKILKEFTDPDFLKNIDKTKNIIFCIPPSDICLLESEMPDIMSIILSSDMNLSAAATISQTVISNFGSSCVSSLGSSIRPLSGV